MPFRHIFNGGLQRRADQPADSADENGSYRPFEEGEQINLAAIQVILNLTE